MNVMTSGLFLLVSAAAFGQTSIPISGRDRVYTADQTSNTVSVIDPSSNKLLGVIRLGDPVPPALSPLYRGQLLVHGLGFAPDSRTLAVVSVGSNSVTLIETATNKIKGTIYVGRSPHEAFYTPDGKELWVSVRGEDYISIIDSALMKEVRRLKVANGPGMVIFREARCRSSTRCPIRSWRRSRSGKPRKPSSMCRTRCLMGHGDGESDTVGPGGGRGQN